MKRVHLFSASLLLAVTTSAWAAGIEPYPEAVQGPDMSTKARSAVIAELNEAQRLGLMTIGEGDFPSVNLNLEAGGTVVVRGDARELRTKISAEAAKANGLGLLSVGEGNAPIATAEQEELIAAAGRHAVEAIASAQSMAQTAAK